jgi:hypothetical protein
VLFACPSLILHDAVVGEHLDDGGPVRQQPEFLGRAGLELAAVLDDGRADGGDAGFRSDHRAPAMYVNAPPPPPPAYSKRDACLPIPTR